MPDDKRSSSSERDVLIAEVGELIARETAETDVAMARSVKRVPRLLIAVWVLVVANVGLWLVFPPAGPETGDRRTAQEVERDLRHALAAAAADVETWRAAHNGRIPASLSEAQAADTAFEFIVRDSASYEIRGASGAMQLSYHSGVPLETFLAEPGARP